MKHRRLGSRSLHRLLDAQSKAGAQADNVEFLRLDEAFHQALAHAAGTDYAWRVLENLKAQMDRVRYLSMPDATPFDVLVGQHAAITDAIARHSADEAESAMRVHLSEIFDIAAAPRPGAPGTVCRLRPRCARRSRHRTDAPNPARA